MCIRDSARTAYDLVLMDGQMPEMDGYEATIELRRREGNGRRVPVIALTANAIEGERERCLSIGMDDFVTKPVKLTELSSVIARHLPRAPGNGIAVPTSGSALS